MKTKLFFTGIILLFISCTPSKNSTDFIKKTTGRYFFNADEIIEVKFNDGTLFLTWRNQNLTPLKINDSTFYVSELNEKLIFNTSKNNIALAKKREHKNNTYIFNKLTDGEKTPKEYFNQGNYKAALLGYKKIKEKDSLNVIIRENTFNRLGYQYIRDNQYKKALAIFKINIELYPNSSNTYDSTGDAYLKTKDTLKAIEFYKKALAINPENNSAKRTLTRLIKTKKN